MYGRYHSITRFGIASGKRIYRPGTVLLAISKFIVAYCFRRNHIRPCELNSKKVAYN